MNKELYIQVKRYYKGEMSPEERSNWEARLASDASFAHEALSHARMYEHIQQQGDQLLNTQLHALGQQLIDKAPKAKTKPLFRRTPFLISSAAAVILLFSLIFTLTPTQNSETLFAENFKPATGSRGADVLQSPFFEAYDNGDFEKAINIYQQDLADSPAALQPNVNLYLGISYLSENQTDSALIALNRVSDKIPALYDDAQWYLALTYLKMDKREEAKKRLQQIANDNLQEWSDDASRILKDL